MERGRARGAPWSGPAEGRAAEPVALDGPGAAALDALDALGSGGTWEAFGRKLRLTNLDKVLFPARPGEAPVTKRELSVTPPISLPSCCLTYRPASQHAPVSWRGGH